MFLKKLCQSPAIVRRKMNIDWGYLHQGDQHRSWMQLQKYRSFYKYWKLLGSNLFTYYFYDNFILEMIYSISSIMDSFIKIIKSHFFKKKTFLKEKNLIFHDCILNSLFYYKGNFICLLVFKWYFDKFLKIISSEKLIISYA